MHTNLPAPPEGVKYLVLTPEKIKRLWKAFNETSGILDDFTRNRFDIFLATLMDGKHTIWLELPDDKGVVYATRVKPGLAAWVHFSFWDRKLVGKRDLVDRCLKWLVNSAQLVKVNVWVPSFCKNMIRFTKKLGFKPEGKIRNWSFDKGKPYDIACFGMTREEVLYGDDNGNLRTDKHGRKQSDVPESDAATG